MNAAEIAVGVLGIYLAIGLIFSIYFVTLGVGKIDPSAREGTWGFRVLIVPGAAAFWPLLFLRIVSGKSASPEETNAHRALSRASKSRA